MSTTSSSDLTLLAVGDSVEIPMIGFETGTVVRFDTDEDTDEDGDVVVVDCEFGEINFSLGHLVDPADGQLFDGIAR